MIASQFDNMYADNGEQTDIFWVTAKNESRRTGIRRRAINKKRNFITDVGNVCLAHDIADFFARICNSFLLHLERCGTDKRCGAGNNHGGQLGQIIVRRMKAEGWRLNIGQSLKSERNNQWISSYVKIFSNR